MLISSKHLKDAGVHVIAQENGRTLKGDLYVEINLEHVKPLPRELNDAVEEMVGSELSEALIEEFASRVNALHMAEIIRKTERKAWFDRRRAHDFDPK